MPFALQFGRRRRTPRRSSESPGRGRPGPTVTGQATGVGRWGAPAPLPAAGGVASPEQALAAIKTTSLGLVLPPFEGPTTQDSVAVAEPPGDRAPAGEPGGLATAAGRASGGLDRPSAS
jgi:hypothetical protein